MSSVLLKQPNLVDDPNIQKGFEILRDVDSQVSPTPNQRLINDLETNLLNIQKELDSLPPNTPPSLALTRKNRRRKIRIQ